MRSKTQRLMGYCFSICLLISAIPEAYSNSTSANNTHQQNNELSTHKAELKGLLARFENFQANFTQSITDVTGEELQSASGTILLVKPQKLRWEVAFPEESLLIADGKTVFNVDPFLEQVTLLEQDELTNNNPLMLLTTDDESQWQQVDVVFNEGYYILSSKDDDAIIETVTLKFNDKSTLTELVSVDRQQQTNTIVFSKVQQNIALPNDIFTYDIQSNWVVDDQRTLGQ